MIKYKESGIEWIGQVPDDWQICRHKDIMKKVKNICFHYAGEDILSLTMNGVIKRDLENPTGKMPATFDGYQIVEKGNLLLCLFDIDVTPRCVGLIKDNGLTSPAYSHFVLKKGAFASYYDYLLRYIDDTKQFLHLSKNLRSSLTEDDFGMIGTIKPSLETQKKIVEILDKKCAQIDELIKLQEQEIEKLNQYKLAIISETVTKGLDKNVKMKDSGIDWIGQIPEDWEIVTIGSCFKNRKVKVSDKEFLPLSVAKIGVVPQMENVAKSDASDDRKLVCDGDFVINSRSDRKMSCGFSRYNGSVSLINTVLTPLKNIVPEYTNYLLKNYGFAEEFYRWGHGIVADLWTTNWEEMKKIVIPLPNKTEQKDLVEFLDKKCFSIDELIDKKKQKGLKLQDYKKSLIYEYVTGKKEV